MPRGSGSTDGAMPNLRRVGQRPGFWLACSAVFIVNAVLSAFRGQWGLAALEIVTGILAVIAAVGNWSAPRTFGRAGRSHDETRID